jgi:hypothetical protein
MEEAGGVSKAWRTGLASWTPQKGSKADRLLADAVQVLEQYVGSGVVSRMTSRAVLYRLIDLGWSKTNDGDLVYVLNRARRSGKIPFHWIADGRSETYDPSGWESADEFKRSFRLAAEHFRLDRLRGQPNIELWIETAGMLEMLEPLARELGVPMFCSSGFNTLTAKYEAAERLFQNDRMVVVFVGDLDPWGEARYSNVEEDVRAIAADLGWLDDGSTEFLTAALAREQVTEHGLLTVPAKAKRDKKTGEALADALPAGWNIGDPTAQAEALPPDVLVEAIRSTVMEYVDEDVLEETLADEEEQRAELLAWFEPGGTS